MNLRKGRRPGVRQDRAIHVLAVGGLVLAMASGCSDAPVLIQRPAGDTLVRAAVRHRPATYEYRIGPGDVLRVNVYAHPELGSGVYRANTPGSPVDGSGAISLPLIGELPVSGLTAREVADVAQTALREYIKDPRVDVSVLEYGSQRVFVLGEVRKPGMFVLDRPTTALEALALTGGFTSQANRQQVALVRGSIRDGNMILFTADDLDPAAGTTLQPGDILFVGRRYWAGISQAAQDLVPILQAASLPVATARDVAFFTDIVGGS